MYFSKILLNIDRRKRTKSRQLIPLLSLDVSIQLINNLFCVSIMPNLDPLTIFLSISLLYLSNYTMPIVTVSMYSSRTQREKDRLAEAMTEDIAKILNIKKER